MLLVIATVTTPQARALHDALSAQFQRFRAEDGCLFYSVGIEDEAAGRLIAVEKWRDQACMEQHNAGPALTEAVAPFADSLNVEIEVIPLGS